MSQPQKPDLRKTAGVKGSVSTGLDERQAGAEPARILPQAEGHLLRPGIGEKVPDGQATKSS